MSVSAQPYSTILFTVSVSTHHIIYFAVDALTQSINQASLNFCH